MHCRKTLPPRIHKVGGAPKPTCAGILPNRSAEQTTACDTRVLQSREPITLPLPVDLPV